MEPNFPRAHLVVGAYVEKGQFANALADLDQWEDAAWTLSWRIYIYGRHGQQPQARRALEKLHQLNRREYISPDAFLWAYLGMGNKDEAFAWFERAYADHSNSLISLKVNPAYDPLRSDPRFQDLMRRVGLDSN
jgi:tetratricopeptide (TPR) repeat protein